MGVWNKAVFNVLCIVLIVFTTIAPPLAFANDDSLDMHTINIHAGSKERSIITAGGAILQKVKEGQFTQPITMYWTTRDSANLFRISTVSIKPTEEYKVIYNVRYYENGVFHTYYDEQIINGSSLLGITEIIIPANDSLLKTSVKIDNEDFNLESMEVMSSVNKESWSSNYRVNLSDGYLVSENPQKLHFKLTGKENSVKQLLIGMLTIGETLDYNTLKNDTSLVELEGDYEYLSINTQGSSPMGITLWESENEKIEVSNGKYDINITSGGQSWSGSFGINGDQKIQIPTKPTLFEFQSLHATPSVDSLQIYYYSELKSGQFSKGGNSDKDILFEIYNGSEKVKEWTEKSFYSIINIESRDLKNGTYTLKATYPTTEGQLLVAESEFKFTAGIQELKGTVFTAEIASGEPLESGTVTLYEKTNENGRANYRQVISRQIQLEGDAYEAFIPDTYILKGKEYYVIIMDDSTKTLYSREIIGQEEKTYHFEGSSLVQMKTNTKAFKTEDVSFSLYDAARSTNLFQFNDFGWHIAIEKNDVILTRWYGTDDNHSMYKWTGELTGEIDSIDLENVEWQTVKPATKYKNASLFDYETNKNYSELYVSEKIVFNPSVYLEVKDGSTTYRGRVFYSNGVKEQEVEFKPYEGTASIIQSNPKVVHTSYRNSNDPLNIEGDIYFTYEIFDEKGKRIGEPITTSNFRSFTLLEPLPQGNYTIKLVNSTVNNEIVSISMDTPIGMGGQHLTLPIDVNTKYGLFRPQELIIQINDPQDMEFYKTLYFRWVNGEKVFESINNFEIKPEKQYKIMLKGMLNQNTGVMDFQVISGEQLLSISKVNPLRLSDEMQSVKITSNYDSAKSTQVELSFGLAEDGDGYSPFRPIYMHGNGPYQLLVSPGNYHGRIIEIDNSRNATVREVPKTIITGTTEIAVKPKDLAKVTIKNESSDLEISGFEFYPYIQHIYEEAEWFQSVSLEKGYYDSISYHIGTNATYDTPWGYNVEVQNVDLNDDKVFNFNANEISGIITELDFFKFDEGDSYLNFSFSLRSGDFVVKDIYRELERNRFLGIMEAKDDPIRDYRGLFTDNNAVPVEFKVKDQIGKIVWETTGSFYNGSLYINKELAEGKYTLEVEIPTGLRKTLTLNRSFDVSGSNTPYVQINSPQNDSVTNVDSITVSGKANAEASVTLELLKEGMKVEGVNITANAEGDYTHTFKPATDGIYLIVVTNEQAKDTIVVTVDRIPPEKANGIEFIKEASGLNVTWTGAKDAVSFKIEVAENGEAFKVLSEAQKETTTIIPNIKPGATYKVKITSKDAAGNKSVSGVATFTVEAFTATSITLKDARNADELLSIGDELAITIEGSYEEGFTAVAKVVVDNIEKEFTLEYNETTKMYEGVFIVKEGQEVIDKVTGYIMNSDEKTEEISKDLAWSVGSSVKGFVSDGTPVEGATVRLSTEKTYTIKTGADGAFELKGLPSGTYKVTVIVNGKTYKQHDLEVAKSKIVKESEFMVPAFTDATITIFDKGTDTPVMDSLSTRLTGPNGFIVFGKTKDGKFITNDGKTVLSDLEAGDYKLTIYGQGAYQTTTATVTLVKGTTAYKAVVNKLTIDEKTLTIKIKGGVEKIDSISLFSYSTYKKHDYNGTGSYYMYNVKPDNGVIVFNRVPAADDYTLDIYTDGFISVHKSVDMTKVSDMEIDLEKGLIVTGMVTDGNEEPVRGAYVYAYSGDTFASARTDADGMYKLIGLSKRHDISIEVQSDIHLFHQERIVVEKDEDEIEKDIQLAKAASLTGKVIDRNGQPMANVSISAYAEGKNYSYGWGRTGEDGEFTVNGLIDMEMYTLSFYTYGYPTKMVEGQKPGPIGEIILQAEANGDISGDGNYLVASKSSVVPGEEIQYTLAYMNNGKAEVMDVPVTLTLPEGLKLITDSISLNGKHVEAEGDMITISTVQAGESGKITFSAKVEDVEVPTLTARAKVTREGAVLSATTSVVFVTLEAPALTGDEKIKVYGNAKSKSTIELFAGNKKVGATKVDGKWWFVDVELPLADLETEETFSLYAKVTDEDGKQSTKSKPVTVIYQPNVPKMTDVTVHAGWNGDVKLNPYTGVATFAIVEHTPLDTTVKFDKEVDSATISFLGKTHDLVKGEDNTFTFDGSKLGRWTSYGEQLLEITFKKGDVEVTVPLMNIIVLIDPSGYVFEGSMENRLEGVQAVVETKIDGEWVQWDAAKFGQVNPQITDEEGRYGWDVIAGEWRVIFTKDGYEPYISRVMNVPPPETELNVPMVRNTNPVIVTTEVTADDLTVEFDRLMNIADKSTNIQLFEGDSDTRIEGTVETVDLIGYKSIDTPEDKKAGHSGKDNKGENGFFISDKTKKLSKTFKFVPKTNLKAGTTYRLVIKGQIEDSGERMLGADKEFTFTTKSSTSGDVTYIPSIPPVKPEPVTPPVFTDITNTFAKDEINSLAAKGIIQGKTENEFAPNAQITRAEFAVLLARALDLPLKEYEGKFSDVNTSKKWAYEGVEAAARAGIVNGTADGKFNPDAPIKREEIAAMIMRAILYQDKAKLEGIELPAHFNDHGFIGSFAIESVYKAAAIGVIKGNNGNFMPKNNATRAEAAVMLYRALDVLHLLD